MNGNGKEIYNAKWAGEWEYQWMWHSESETPSRNEEERRPMEKREQKSPLGL